MRSLIGSFAMLNQVQFNRADGAGYEFLAAIVLRADELNPQLAARLLTAFSTWRMMETTRRAHAEQALLSIAEKPNLSRDVGDIVSRSLEERANRNKPMLFEVVTQLSQISPRECAIGKFFINLSGSA